METDLLSRLNATERRMDHPNVRPKDAATLLILKKTKSNSYTVLMGRRSLNHRFMPGKFVFPGGRVDPEDSRVPIIGQYHPLIADKLMYKMKTIKTATRARALSIASIRETFEEAGIFIGKKTGVSWNTNSSFEPFSKRGIQLDLSPIRYIARAITPPRRPRRFDTRFFAVFENSIADHLPENIGPSDELEDLHWIPLTEARKLELPTITQVIIEGLLKRLNSDPTLSANTPTPFYYWRGKNFRCEII